MTTSNSRYQNVGIVSGSLDTFEFPSIDVTKIRTLSVRITTEDRLDTLAFKYLGSGQYWWIIAMINNIEWAWDFEPGQIILIPSDIKDILDKI